MNYENREPLASKIRPKTFKEFVGQEHLIGIAKPLRVAIEKKQLFSFILWGPPGCGKTTLARMYANAVGADFYELSAVDSGKEDIKKIIAKGQIRLSEKPKILFIDEIHRFNKAQQDFLLPFVERGDITFIGATTENPSFEVIAPLLSRTRVFVLHELSDKDMGAVLLNATKELSAQGRSASGGKTKLSREAKEWLIQMAGGDARQAITTLETAQKLYGEVSVDSLKEAVQSRQLRYDKKGDEHFNTVSAFIKSMRASQPDAALYYLARMVEAGEDPLFIARRMVIFASEDIGLAGPTALVVANAVFRACETVGYPEAQINLAHGAAYLATSKKSRASHDAYFEALEDVKKEGNLPIPMNIRNAPTKLMKNLGYGKGYEMYPSKRIGTSDYESYLPEKLAKKKYLKD